MWVDTVHTEFAKSKRSWNPTQSSADTRESVLDFAPVLEKRKPKCLPKKEQDASMLAEGLPKGGECAEQDGGAVAAVSALRASRGGTWIVVRGSDSAPMHGI